MSEKYCESKYRLMVGMLVWCSLMPCVFASASTWGPKSGSLRLIPETHPRPPSSRAIWTLVRCEEQALLPACVQHVVPQAMGLLFLSILPRHFPGLARSAIEAEVVVDKGDTRARFTDFLDQVVPHVLFFVPGTGSVVAELECDHAMGNHVIEHAYIQAGIQLDTFRGEELEITATNAGQSISAAFVSCQYLSRYFSSAALGFRPDISSLWHGSYVNLMSL